MARLPTKVFQVMIAFLPKLFLNIDFQVNLVRRASLVKLVFKEAKVRKETLELAMMECQDQEVQWDNKESLVIWVSKVHQECLVRWELKETRENMAKWEVLV